MEIAFWIDTPALGDTIAAIPTLRKLSEAYGNEPITVFTTKPFLFDNHPLVKQAFKSDADKSDYKVYRSFSQLVGKQYDMQNQSIEFRHPNIDLRQFHAVSLGFTLTNEEMTTDLYIENKVDIDFKDYVIMHTTHTWATRTWDQDKWQDLVYKLNDLNIPVIAIGRDSTEAGFFDTQKPVMSIDIPLGLSLLNNQEMGIAEIRWLMNNSKAVITMDSGILHVAGTTDANIIQLGSSINYKLRAPWRNGTQDYKYTYVGGGCNVFCSSNMKYNVNVHGSIHGVPPQVVCLEGKPTFECHPSVDQVFDAITPFYNVKPNIRLVHLLLKDDKTPIRQELSIESIKQLTDRGVEYVQVWNNRWVGEVPRETFADPANYDTIPIGPGHYGNFRAFADSAMEYYTEDLDAMIFCEGDAILVKPIKEVVDDINRAWEATQKLDIAYFSFGDRYQLENGSLQSNTWSLHEDIHIVDKVIGAQMVMVPAKFRSFLIDRFNHHTWTTADIFLNNIFTHKFNIGIFDKPVAIQADGISAIDSTQRTYIDEKSRIQHKIPRSYITEIKYKIDYDFIEIGTSDFDTLIEQSDGTQTGLSIEPISKYLNALPDSNGVTKVNAAISDVDGTLKMYYIKDEDIYNNSLPNYIRGCNSADKPHQFAMKQIGEELYNELVTIEDVPALSWNTLIENYNIGGIKYLKIDTEGHEFKILNSYFELCKNDPTLYADKILFEYNENSNSIEIEGMLNTLSNYEITRMEDDILLEKIQIVEKAYITHCNEAYLPIVQKMVETVREFSELPIIVYVLNSDAKVTGTNIITHRLDVDIREGNIWIEGDNGNKYVERKSPAVYDVITKKVNATIHALNNYANTIVYLDGDSIATPKIDELFDYDRTDLKHPLFTHGLRGYMMSNGKGNPFVTGPNGEEQWKTDVSLTLEQPLCDLLNVDNSYRLETLGYVQTGYFVANKNSLEFLKEWQDLCDNPTIFNRADYYAPFHEETIVNVLMWKYKYSERLPLCYINVNDPATIDEVYTKLEYNGAHRQYRHDWLVTPGHIDHIKVLHGEKRPDVVDQLVNGIKKYLKPKNKKRIVFLAPHLSTGGMPEFLLHRIKALQDQDEFEIHIIEYNMYADTYVVQRNQIEDLVGNNFHSLGYLDVAQDVREIRLKRLLETINPDVIHIEECPEAFDGFNKMSPETQGWIYNEERPWKIVETCHNIWFAPKEAKRFSPDAYALVSPEHANITFADEVAIKQEIHFPIIEQSVSQSQRRKLKEFFGFDPDAKQYHLVNIGLWTPGKNQGEAIQWARALEAREPGRYQFHFIGNQASNFVHYWEPLMEDLPANCRVWGERNDIDKFYGIADAIVFNSTWECNPLTIRQSLGWPLHIVARNLPQYWDLYRGLLTEIIGELEVDLVRLIEALESPAPERNNEFTMARFKQEHLDLYIQTINGPKNRKRNNTLKDWEITWDSGPKVTSKSDRAIKCDFLIDGKSMYSHTLNGEGHWCKPAIEYWADWTVVVDDEENRIETTGSTQIIRFDSNSLGDSLSWVEPCVEFKSQKGLEKLYIATHKNWLFDEAYYRNHGIEFIAPGEWPEDAVALWKVGVYMEDVGGEVWFHNKNKRDWRKIYLGDIASDCLDVDQVMRSPKLAYSGKTKQKRPYICIATASTAQAKYWNHPTGWQDLVNHYKAKGYDVYHISKEATDLKGIKKSTKDLADVYRLLQGAETFYGISSGLTWFAWATSVPVVLISGFTPEVCEFNNERTLRIINKAVCNSCWFREHFDRGDWNWCPDHKGTDRQFECTTTITAESVIEQVEAWKLNKIK